MIIHDLLSLYAMLSDRIFNINPSDQWLWTVTYSETDKVNILAKYTKSKTGVIAHIHQHKTQELYATIQFRMFYLVITKIQIHKTLISLSLILRNKTHL